MRINRDKLISLYLKKVDEICEICEDKSCFYPEEIMHIVADLLEKNPDLIINKND